MPSHDSESTGRTTLPSAPIGPSSTPSSGAALLANDASGAGFEAGRQALSPSGSGESTPRAGGARRGGKTVVVQRGDTLWALASREYGDGRLWTRLRDANPTRVARGGQVILIGSALVVPPLASADGQDAVVSPRRSIEAGDGPTVARASPTAESVEPAAATGASRVLKDREARDGSDALSALGGAVECLFPALKFDAEKMPETELPPIVLEGVVVRSRMRLSGRLTAQREGTCGLFTLSQSAYEVSARQTFREFASKVSLSATGPSNLSLSHEIVGPYSQTSVKVSPPNRIVYTFAPRPVDSHHDGWMIAGRLGYAITLEATPMVRAPVPAEVPWYEQVGEWLVEHSDYAVAAGLAVAGTAIVAATLAEDAATFGAGAADDPLSFAAAAQMFGLAVQFAR